MSDFPNLFEKIRTKVPSTSVKVTNKWAKIQLRSVCFIAYPAFISPESQAYHTPPCKSLNRIAGKVLPPVQKSARNAGIKFPPGKSPNRISGKVLPPVQKSPQIQGKVYPTVQKSKPISGHKIPTGVRLARNLRQDLPHWGTAFFIF